MGERIRIAVPDAEHPDELPAGEPCDAMHNLLDKEPLDGVTPLIGNTVAYAYGPDADGQWLRAEKTNLVLAEADRYGNPEEQRKAELLYDVYPGYDLVMARHGTFTPGLSYAACHQSARPEVWNAVAALELEHVVHTAAPTFCELDNYLTVDLGPDSPLTVRKLHGLLGRLAAGEIFKPRPITRYTALPLLSVADAELLDLPHKLPPFTPLDETVAKLLGYPQGAICMMVDRVAYDHTGIWSEPYLPLQLTRA